MTELFFKILAQVVEVRQKMEQENSKYFIGYLKSVVLQPFLYILPSCGDSGTKNRRRNLIIPAPPGQHCQGSGDEVQKCNVQPCMKGTYFSNQNF